MYALSCWYESVTTNALINKKSTVRNLDDIKAESTVDEDEETADVKEETAAFGRKFLVFESNLFELFQNCYKCLAPSEPRIEKSVGSMIVIVSKCKNGHIRSWTSQQCDGQMPWGNMLCAAGTLFTGSNPARIDSFFKHLGIQYMSLRTYYKIQKFYLAPAVSSLLYLNHYRVNL